MRQFKEFKSEQKYVTEIGPIAGTFAAVAGLIGGAMAAKKLVGKFKSYKQSQAEKKANRESGVEIEVKKINPETGEEYEELVPLTGKDANLDADGVEKKRKEMQGKYNNLEKGKDKAKANAKIRDVLGKGPKDIITKDDQKKGMALIKKELEPDAPEEPETTPPESGDDSSEPEQSPEQELRSKGDKDPKDGGINDDGEANKYKKLTGKAPRGWRTFTYKSGASELRMNKESKVLKFGEFISEDVMKDLKKISKSKKDMEIKLGDGSEIPIDPMTAEIFVKYIEGLKSSEQKKVINQIQRTERGFMKVLGKAHGE